MSYEIIYISKGSDMKFAKSEISYSFSFGKGNESDRVHGMFLSTPELDVYV